MSTPVMNASAAHMAGISTFKADIASPLACDYRTLET
jgi:hypothetical protein